MPQHWIRLGVVHGGSGYLASKTDAVQNKSEPPHAIHDHTKITVIHHGTLFDGRAIWERIHPTAAQRRTAPMSFMACQ